MAPFVFEDNEKRVMAMYFNSVNGKVGVYEMKCHYIYKYRRRRIEY